MIKRDALKGSKAFQFTTVTSWTASTHLDQSDALLVPASLTRSLALPECHRTLLLFLSLFSSQNLCLLPFIWVRVLSLSLSAISSLPSPLTSSPFLSAEASHQSR